MKLLKICIMTLSTCVLSGCGPSFRIEKNQNAFGGTLNCQMKNNLIKKTNVTANLAFDIIKNTATHEPYVLTLSSANEGPVPEFKKDPQLILALNVNQNLLKLQAFDAQHTQESYTTHTPGSFNDKKVYSPGYSTTTTTYFSNVSFYLSLDQVLQLAHANELNFQVESSNGNPVVGELDAKNLKNLQQFENECIAYTNAH